MATKEFDAETLRELVYCSKHNNYEGLTKIKTEHIEEFRWETEYELIFQENETGKFYSAVYFLGNTEYQENSWFGTDDKVICTEVKPVEVTKIEYHAV